MKLPTVQFGLLMLAASLLLTGCSTSSLSSEEVMQRFAQSLSELTSFHYDLDLQLSGDLPTGLEERISGAAIQLSGDVDNRDSASPHFTVGTTIRANSDLGDIAMAGQLISANSYTYFKLTDLVFPTLLPIALGADSRWYKIKHPSSSEDIDSRLGVEVAAQLSPDQIQTMRDLIASSPLFEVVEILPDETITGQRSYHYWAKLDQDNLQDVISRLGQVVPTYETPQNLEAIANYRVELWINKRTFQLSRLKLDDIYLVNGVPVAFTLDLAMSRHNEALPITAPDVSEEVDEQRLLFLSELGL